MAFVQGYKHDVFISYAHADNEVDALGDAWVHQLAHNLKIALKQRLGRDDALDICFDFHRMKGDNPLDSILDSVRQSAVFLAIGSPSYVNRQWTRDELGAFVAISDDPSRLFALERLPLDPGERYPDPLNDYFRINFWQSETDIPLTLTPRLNTTLYYVRLQTLAEQIRGQLAAMSNLAAPRASILTERSLDQSHAIKIGEGAGGRPRPEAVERTIAPEAVPSVSNISNSKFVFVSFSRNDQVAAHEIVSWVEKAGIRCWISSRNIPYGSDFQDSIVQALESAEAMILIFSEHANNSSEIKKELAIASEHGLLVIPVRIQDVMPTRGLRYQLATRQYINLFENREQNLELVVSALRDHLSLH